MARDRTAKRKLTSLNRREEQSSPTPFILIVCEGAKTEVNYFTEIFQFFKVPKTTYSCIQADGTQPLKVVETAIDYCGKNCKWELVYCVFDRDDHDGYSQAITKAEKQTLKNGANKDIVFTAIPSNPCFELWLLSHYKEYNREDHRSKIFSELKKHIADYEKGKSGIFNDTKAKWKDAAERVKMQPGRNDYQNPSTRVDLLVEKLHSLYLNS